ncbi:MAG: hypothetical protein DMD73_10325 [Gemmatimonadetes bacterium]|nr:MAG: hypothetical protein DMD73_10325 [Gemmatimonadota bacterium]
MARRVTLIGGVLLAAACVERVSAPGDCPAFCPSGQIEIVDTVLTSIISRDSTFRGYVTALSAPLLLAADLPGFVDGRAIFRINGFGQRFILSTADTGAILGADSARLQLTVARRDTGAHNLSLAFYRLPITVDSTTTFAGLAGPFTDSLVKRVNIDTLLARPGHKDTLTGDSVVVDTVNNVLVLALKFDTAAARYVGTDSGTVAYGVRVSADSLASIAITRSTLSWQWYLRVDSIGTPVARKPGSLGAAFSSFVFDPPPPPPDSTLAVGGVPSARSFLRVAFPHFIRDSSQIIRGTLTLVPVAPVQGAPSDSFVVEAHTVFTDVGAKSPIIVDATRTDTAIIHIGPRDTAQIEVTNLLQFWASDTTRATTLVLRAKQEAASFSLIRFYPSVAQAFRPALRITFVRRFPFGAP